MVVIHSEEIFGKENIWSNNLCGQGDELGTLERGKLADLIVVDGNTLDDLNGMDAVLHIVKDGEVYSTIPITSFANEE